MREELAARTTGSVFLVNTASAVPNAEERANLVFNQDSQRLVVVVLSLAVLSTSTRSMVCVLSHKLVFK